MGNKQDRNEAAVITTTAGSVITAIGGIGVLLICPPAGAALISAGVSGTINSVSQIR